MDLFYIVYNVPLSLDRSKFIISQFMVCVFKLMLFFLAKIKRLRLIIKSILGLFEIVLIK